MTNATPKDPLRNPSECPAPRPFGPSFGARHVSRSPAESLLRKPFGTCPTERPPSEPFGARHVSRSPDESPLRSLLRTYLWRMPRVPSDRPREYSQEGCERATCPECRSQDNPPRMPCESATRPEAHTESPTGRFPDHPSEAFRK